MKTPRQRKSIRPIENERGQSLVQVLISAAAMGFLLLVMASVQTMQQREQRALMEKLSAVDVMRVMTTTVSNQATCGAVVAASNLVNPSQLPFNAATTSISATNPYVIKLKQIPNVNIAPGGAPSPMSETLKLASSAASESGLQIVFTDPTTASLQVNFDQAKLIRPIKNLSFPLVTSVIAGSTTISGCKASAGGTCPTGQIMTGINPDGSPKCSAAGGGTCPTGQMMTGTNPDGSPKCTAAAAPAAGGACPSGQFVIGINPNGSPQCTSPGSQAGAPCSVVDGGTTYNGITTIVTGAVSGRCCLSNAPGYSPTCPTF